MQPGWDPVRASQSGPANRSARSAVQAGKSGWLYVRRIRSGATSCSALAPRRASWLSSTSRSRSNAQAVGSAGSPASTAATVIPGSCCNWLPTTRAAGSLPQTR